MYVCVCIHVNVIRKKGKENTVAQDYVLPDYTHIKRGYVRPTDQPDSKSKGAEQVAYIAE